MKLNSRLVLAAALLTAAISAQTKTANFTRTYGPSDPKANLNIDLQATVTRGVGTLSAHAHARASLNIISWTARALSIDANARTQSTGFSGSVKVTVAGFNELNESRSGLFTWAGKWGPKDLFAQDPEVPVPFTAGLVKVGVNVGGGAEITIVTSGNPSTMSVSLGGSGRVYGTGRVTFTLGILGFRAGASVDLRFLDTIVAPFLSASATTLKGVLTLTMTPIAIILKGFISLPFVGQVASKQVWSYTAAALESSLTAL